MFHRIVCGPCQVEFQCFKNGVLLVDYASFGAYKSWEADEWRCPNCGTKIITGFADRPDHHIDPGFAKGIKAAEEAGRLRGNYETSPLGNHAPSLSA